MVRVDRGLKQCYFYRLIIDGDVKKPNSLGELSPDFPKSEIPNNDIIPYNPHFRQRNSRQTARLASNRRISWSREADRVREISPRSEPEPAKIFYPPPATSVRSVSYDYGSLENKYPLDSKPRKKKKTKSIPSTAATPARPRSIVSSSSMPEPTFEPIFTPPTFAPKKKFVTKKSTPKKSQQIREQQEKRYRAQKLEQSNRRSANVYGNNLRGVKSETDLRAIPKEPLMKKAESGKTKHFNPPRWRHVGNRNQRREGDKNARSFASDYYF